MKRANLAMILAVFISGLFITSETLAQGKLPIDQRPGIQKPSPLEYGINPKLQELIKAEEAKRAARVRMIETRISERLAQEKVFKGPFLDPQIKSVYPSEVYPGDPVLISGIGFSDSQGKGVVQIVGPNLNQNLQINSWSSNNIKGKIPPIGGFTLPIRISFKVVRSDGKVSQSSAGVDLKPNTTIEMLPFTGAQLVNGGPGTNCYVFRSTNNPYQVIHRMDPGCKAGCQGSDVVYQTMQLKNQWRLYHVSIQVWCWHLFHEPSQRLEFRGDTPKSRVPIGCTNSYARIRDDMTPYLGAHFVPGIVVDWAMECFNKENESTELDHIVYAYVSGPVGTKY